MADDRLNFVLPVQHKRAFNMIAADLGVSASDLLREMVENKVRTYRDGIFFDVTASGLTHNSDNEHAGAEVIDA